MPNRIPAPEICPVCGGEVPPGARACPECGADERSGWNEEDARYDGLDLPDDEVPQPVPAKRISGPVVVAAIALVLAIVFIIKYVLA